MGYGSKRAKRIAKGMLSPRGGVDCGLSAAHKRLCGASSLKTWAAGLDYTLSESDSVVRVRLKSGSVLLSECRDAVGLVAGLARGSHRSWMG